MLAAFTIGSAWAQVPVNEFVSLEVGLKFKVLDEEAKTVQIGIENTTSYDARWFGDIVLPETVLNPLNNETYTVTVIGKNAFAGAIGITSVTMPATLDSIGVQAFAKCLNLKEVIFNDGLRYIDESAFANCVSLPEVIIPESVEAIGCYAFNKCSILEYIYIPESVTLIGDGAFADCGNLRQITLPSAITEIRNSMFMNCSKLETVIMPGVTTVGCFAFKNCTELSQITANLNNVTYFGESAFEACKALANVNINSNVTNVGINAFKGTAWIADVFDSSTDNIVYDPTNTVLLGCKDNKSIIGGVTIDGSTKVIAPEAFSGCMRMTAVSIPDGVISIGRAAFRYTGLKDVTLPSSVTILEDDVFANCFSLQTVNTISQITSIGRSAFFGCTNLNIKLTDFSSLEYIHDHAFSYCTKLPAVLELPKTTIKYIGINPFSYCTQITEFKGLGAFGYSVKNKYIIHDIQADYSNIPFETEYGCYKDEIYAGLRGEYADQPAEGEADVWTVLVSAPGTINSWTDPGTDFIGRDAFRGAKINADITLGSKTTNIRVGAFKDASANKSITANIKSVYRIEDDAFSGFYNLKTVNADNCIMVGASAFASCRQLEGYKGPANVCHINNEAFANTTKLTTFTFPANVPYLGERAFFGSGLTAAKLAATDLGVINYGTFENCGALSEVTLPAGLDEIRDKAFYNCAALKKFNFAEAPELKFIGNEAFYNCRALPEAMIPNSVSYLGHSAFANNKALANVTLPDGLRTIAHSTFLGCERLASIEIPASVNNIEKFAFDNCWRLTAVNNLEETSITIIADGTFSGCCNLSAITLPSSVKRIGVKAFNGCNSLTGVTLNDGLQSIGESAFECYKTYPDMVKADPDGFPFPVTKLKSITFPRSLISIGDKAFAGRLFEEVHAEVIVPFPILKGTFSDETYADALLYVGTKNDPAMEPFLFSEAYGGWNNWNPYHIICNGELIRINLSEDDANGINEITNSDASVQNRYGLNGQMTNGKGLNIIRMSNGQVRKVMVK